MSDFKTDAPTEVLAPIVESPIKDDAIAVSEKDDPKSDLVDGPPGLMDEGHDSDEEEGHQSDEEAPRCVEEHLGGGAVLGDEGKADGGGKVIAGILVASTPGKQAVFVPGIAFVAPVVY